MGNAISFRLNPKNESDKKILDWLEEKSSQPGFLNQTEAIKKAILTAIEDEKNKKREKPTNIIDNFKIRVPQRHESIFS